MDKDILVQTDNYFEEFFADRLTTRDRDEIKEWLTTQLQNERQGWKDKLHMSMREIEKERKAALDNQTVLIKIHTLLQQFVHTYGPILSHDPPPAEESAERTAKPTMAEQADRNLHLLLELVNHFEHERNKCFELLNLKDYQQMYLYEALKAHIEHLRGRIKELQIKSFESDKDLKQQLYSLTIRFEELQRRSEKEQARLATEIKALNEEIDNLRKQSVKIVPKCVEIRHAEAQVEAWCLSPSRECGSQTEPEATQRPTPSATAGSPIPDAFSVFKSNETVQVPKSNIESENTDIRRSTQDLEGSLHSSSVTYLNMDNEPTKSMTEPQARKRAKISSGKKSESTESLRHQVVNYAEKLDKARLVMEQHERQVAGLKIAPRTLPHRGQGGMWMNRSKDWKKPNDSYGIPGAYLGGVKKQLFSSRDRNVVALLHAKSRQGLDPKSSTTAKCLRCHRPYKLRENHKYACRFHPKAKQKLESYDRSGRLVHVTFAWECCLQKPEAPGCCIGEHC